MSTDRAVTRCTTIAASLPAPESQMLSCQSKVAGWSSLPEQLVVNIVQLAFEDTDRTPSRWLRWALVCRHANRSTACLPQCIAQVCAAGMIETLAPSTRDNRPGMPRRQHSLRYVHSLERQPPDLLLAMLLVLHEAARGSGWLTRSVVCLQTCESQWTDRQPLRC